MSGNTAGNLPNQPFVPVLSFTLADFLKQEIDLASTPVYISNATYPPFSIEGKIHGQPFRASFNDTEISGPGPKHDFFAYFFINLPMQGIGYYQRAAGGVEPVYAINYTNMGPETRDDARRAAVFNLTHEPKGKFVFGSDPDIDAGHLEKLKAIAACLGPTMIELYDLGERSGRALLSSRGKGSLDSLVLPTAVTGSQ